MNRAHTQILQINKLMVFLLCTTTAIAATYLGITVFDKVKHGSKLIVQKMSTEERCSVLCLIPCMRINSFYVCPETQGLDADYLFVTSLGIFVFISLFLNILYCKTSRKIKRQYNNVVITSQFNQDFLN